ncbi:MAG: glycosyltransferase family 2 protein [Bacteroidales bacterium]|nr:glycosyltransferase family 2 protein [Bacteroidales bacterium]
MTETTEYSIIIPAYNEETVIGPFLEQMTKLGFCSKHEVILVDDGSTDRTAEIAGQYPIRVIHHGNNKGYGASLKTGIRKANGEKVITLDSDGQHDPAFLSRAMELLENHDMVIGERGIDSFQVRNRKGGKKLIRKVGEYLVEQQLPDFNSGFRGFDRKLILSMLHIMPNGFSFSTTSTLAFLKEGYTIGTFPIKVEERKGRSSNVRFLKDGTKTMLLLFRIIMLFNPLKVFFPASVLFTALGIGWGVYGYLAFQRFSNSAIILITLGMFLFFFGLLADQIALLNRKKS